MPLPELLPLPYQTTPRAYAGAAVGLLALSEDITIESDLRHFFSDERIELYTARVPCDATINAATLAAMGEHLQGALSQLLPGSELDVVAYGCTSGTMVIGEQTVAKKIQAIRPNVSVTNPLSAARAFLSHHHIRHPVVITPYENDVTHQVATALCEDSDRTVSALGSFLCIDDPTVMRIDEDSIYHAVETLLTKTPHADGVFISCTALRLSGVLPKLQKMFDLPISGSNHALAWHIQALLNK